MKDIAILCGILLPFFGTVLGALSVMLSGRFLSSKNLRFLHAGAAGVMTAAAVFSLLIPAISLSPESVPWLPCVIGFLLGAGLILFSEKLLEKHTLKKENSMLMLAVTLHNFPEGMAVGVALAGLAYHEAVSLSAALMLSLGIAIQNIPEGAIIYAPAYAGGASKKKALYYSVLSGIVEPIGAILTFYFTKLFSPLLPYILSLAVGCMLFVVADEMIPSSKKGTASAVPSMIFIFGFALMMLLDVALG